MKKLFWSMIVLFLLVAPVLAQDATEQPTEEAGTMFSYDASAPLNLQVAGTEMRGDVTVKDITYSGPTREKPFSAYLVVPAGNGPFPGILYAHWYDPSTTTSNRTEFLDEAVMMAQT